MASAAWHLGEISACEAAFLGCYSPDGLMSLAKSIITCILTPRQLHGVGHTFKAWFGGEVIPSGSSI